MTKDHKPKGFSAVRYFTESEIKRLQSLYRYDPETGEIHNLKGLEHYWIKNGYGCIGTELGHIYAHRLAWILFYGKNPTETIDHINHCRTDNRICNLRLATMKEQCANRRRRRRFLRTGFKGVYKVSGSTCFFTSHCHVGHDFGTIGEAISFRIRHKLTI